MTRDQSRFESLRPHGAETEVDKRGARAAFAGSQLVDEVPAHKPRGVGEMLDVAFELLRQRFAVYVGVCVLLWAPVRLLQPWIAKTALAPSNLADVDGFPALGFLGLGLSIAGAGFVQAFASALVARMVYASMLGEQVALRAAFAAVLTRILPVLGIAVVTVIMTSMGMLMCLVPGFWLTFKLALAPSVCILEQASVATSLRRSFILTQGSFLRWLGMITVTAILTTPFTSVGAIGDNIQTRTWVIDTFSIDAVTFDVLCVLFSSLFNGVATAISGILFTVLYFDCRMRRDGLDLRLRLQTLSGEHPVAAGARA